MRGILPSRAGGVYQIERRDLQGPELWHVVEAGHRQSADVVIVEGAEVKRAEYTTQI